MAKRFDATLTIFVYLKGHHLLEYYFAIDDTRDAANESDQADIGK